MSVQNEATDQRQAAVYRLWDADGNLLYIGSAYDPGRRYRQHGTKPWWPLVARRAEEWHPSKGAAYTAEMAAIAAEGPAHNHMGTPQYVPPSEKAAARRGYVSGELTVKEIMVAHGISRQSLHTYRQRSDFPLPVSRPGTGGLRWRETDLAAWFQANPPQQGKKRTAPEQGESVSTTTDPRIAALVKTVDEALKSLRGGYHHLAPLTETAVAEAVVEALTRMMEAQRTAVVTEVVEALQAKAGELSELAEEEMRTSLEAKAQVWQEAASLAGRLKRAKAEASDG